LSGPPKNSGGKSQRSTGTHWFRYPNGVRELTDGGTWNTIAGQPTDDSEMALLLARMLADQGRYDHEEARKAYIFWLGPDRIYSHP
jgi:ADP-ribosylglycohydrolase